MILMRKWALPFFLLSAILLIIVLRENLPVFPRSALPQQNTPYIKSNDNCLISEHAADVLDHDGQISVLVWNIHKQADGDWPEALWSSGKHWHLMLLQEVGQTEIFHSAVTRAGFEYANLTAFRFQDVDYGVMTAAKAAAAWVCGSLASEPFLRLPKGALSSNYLLSNGQTLLVINLHGINFDLLLSHWEAQLSDLFSQIAAHKGPVIFGGDFNSWGQDRTARLKQFVESYGLINVEFQPDERLHGVGTALDWLFYRGIELKKAQSPATELSDHAPLLAEFTIPGSTSGGEIPGAHQ
ncbi:endonuclease/exonuclease/phosphatase family protein [Shewanella sp.]|uniref:endonuclease/exonuclease/phosphatase family protein n=1 Tax=Shewanella sp. TaxID=50422 RepID=UPI0035655338